MLQTIPAKIMEVITAKTGICKALLQRRVIGVKQDDFIIKSFVLHYQSLIKSSSQMIPFSRDFNSFPAR